MALLKRLYLTLEKPEEINLIAALVLGNAIINCVFPLLAFCAVFNRSILSFFNVFTPLSIVEKGILTIAGLYSLVLGIFELRYTSQLMADPIKTNRPAKYIAIMEVVNIAFFSILSLVVGLTCLHFYKKPIVIEYFTTPKRLY